MGWHVGAMIPPTADHGMIPRSDQQLHDWYCRAARKHGIWMAKSALYLHHTMYYVVVPQQTSYRSIVEAEAVRGKQPDSKERDYFLGRFV